MLKQIGKNLLYIVPILIIGFILSGCQSQSKTAASPNKQISVVTTTNFYGEVAKQVLGNKGKVTSIINSSSMIRMTMSLLQRRQKKLLKQT